jgi:hypothetical protein
VGLICQGDEELRWAARLEDEAGQRSDVQVDFVVLSFAYAEPAPAPAPTMDVAVAASPHRAATTPVRRGAGAASTPGIQASPRASGQRTRGHNCSSCVAVNEWLPPYL